MNTFFLAYEVSTMHTKTKGWRIFNTTANTPEEIAVAIESKLDSILQEHTKGANIIATAFNRI